MPRPERGQSYSEVIQVTFLPRLRTRLGFGVRQRGFMAVSYNPYMARMLLVEDDRKTALAYESLLAVQRPDIAIDTVVSAERALLRLSEMAYDVILSEF